MNYTPPTLIRTFLFLMCMVLGLSTCLAPLGAADRPNVLFIAADDLRNDLGCLGNEEVLTPHLDRLAEQGRLFKHAYCQQAVCNPSRASLMTGLRPDTLGIWDLPTHFRDVRPQVVTLPQHFMQHGYFTQNVGKIYHNWIHDLQGDPASWSVPAAMHFANHGSDTPQVTGELPPNLASDLKCECRDVPDDAYFDGRVADLAIQALQQRQASSTPFFLAVGFWKPHSPFNAPKKYWDLYDRSQLSPPANPEWPTDAPRIAWHNSREILGRKEPRVLDEASVMEMRHGYLAAISYMDAQVGRVLDELERLDLRKNTIVVFWSDHGYHLGEQTLWAKTSNFELDAAVPLMIATPEMHAAGTATGSLAELLDMYPTLIDLCGLPAVPDLEGKSLKPILENPQATVRSAAFTQHPRPAYYDEQPEVMGRSVRTARYRYTEWRDFTSGDLMATELYDHETDPLETINVAALPEYQQAIRECQQLKLEGFSL
ncbi:sulfatase [Aureliella helgolandensis]|uniref:Choline-sulfatase n=1 Tax=Aureliella helgolandensis TaxID=2527968 RepID=A0A518G1I3_9BACT|nr:sulfatase [Aureliella helgolandensis]QDV22394.1 Choline-sulfatase [Aureliella helgolandensis]